MPPNRAFQRDKSLDQKDFTMTSMNALTVASTVVGYEMELTKLGLAEPPADPVARVKELADEFYNIHMSRVEWDVKQAASNVVTQFPGAKVNPVASGDGNDPGAVVLQMGNKHRGETIASIYESDPTYVRNFLANLDAKNDMSREAKAAAVAFIAQVDEEG